MTIIEEQLHAIGFGTPNRAMFMLNDLLLDYVGQHPRRPCPRPAF